MSARAPSPTSHDAEAVREALQNAEGDAAPWAALLLALHYAVTLLVQLGVRDAAAFGRLRAGLSAAICLALALVWWRRGRVWWPGFGLVALATVVFANSVMRSAVDPQPWLGTRLAILFLGGSLISVSQRAVVAVVAVGLGVWAFALFHAQRDVGWVWESVFVLFAGGMAVLAHHLRVRLVRDVVASQRALGHGEAHLRRAQKLAGLISFEWDLERDLLTWFDGGHRFGRNDRGVGSLAVFVDEVVHPEDRPAVRELIDFCERTESAFQRELRLLAPDGSVRWIETHGVSARDANGRRVVFGAVVDRTEPRGTEPNGAVRA